MFASFQPRIPRRLSHGRQERKDVRLSSLSEFFIQTGRLPAELRQMFKSLPTQKVLLLLDACSRIWNSRSTQVSQGWETVWPTPTVCPVPPSIWHADIDRLIQTHSCISSVYKAFQIPGVCLLAALGWLGKQLDFCQLPYPCFLCTGMKKCLWKWGLGCGQERKKKEE